MHDIQNEQNESLVEFDSIAEQEDRDGNQIDQDEHGLTSDDPPINQRLSGHDQVENTLTKSKKEEEELVNNAIRLKKNLL